MNTLIGEVLTPSQLSGNVGAKTIHIGGKGDDGATFIPSVSADGIISWTNDKDLTNPEPVNIKGEKGDKGDPGEPGADGKDGKDGSPGADGSPGKNGTSATHSWNGTVLTITSASGTSSADLKGDKGEPGEKGADGEKGDKGDKGDQGIQGIQGEPGAAGSNGADGKSAYAYALEGGYTGTEAEFAEKMAEELPTKVSELENDSDYVPKNELPKSLKNPNALTINGVSYDGSETKDFTDAINTMIDSKLASITNAEEVSF